MKNVYAVLGIIFLLCACSSTKKTTTTESTHDVTDTEANTSLDELLDRENSFQIPLISRILKLRGVAIVNGVPALIKSGTSRNNPNLEPLYVIDGHIVGNSFAQAQGLVNSIDVEKVEVLSLADAAFYGLRGGKGVIKITTKKQ